MDRYIDIPLSQEELLDDLIHDMDEYREWRSDEFPHTVPAYDRYKDYLYHGQYHEAKREAVKKFIEAMEAKSWEMMDSYGIDCY